MCCDKRAAEPAGLLGRFCPGGDREFAMLRQEDERAIEDLFERLDKVARNSEAPDQDAEAFIQDKLRQNPDAAYYMAQTIIVQEAALREQQARLGELEQTGERSRGGTLGGIFGDRASERRRGPWGEADDRPARGGGGFLAGAAQTALGVTGGMLLGSAIAGMFGTPASAEDAIPADEPEDTGLEDGGDFGSDDFDMGGDF
jgi:uncharacterized protein